MLRVHPRFKDLVELESKRLAISKVAVTSLLTDEIISKPKKKKYVGGMGLK